MAGIDQMVNQTADAYRNNPQGLQQKYAASQQLIDLLALQRLKSEKEAAARDIQMQMQNNPATIKQQREQELAQMTKQEMIQRVAPTIQRKMQQQQAALQQAPQRAAQAEQGLAALQQQMQQPTQRAASGGIMRAYANGGAVKRYSQGLAVEADDPSLNAEELEALRQLTVKGYSTEEAKEIINKRRYANFTPDEYTPDRQLPEGKSIGRKLSEGLHSILGLEAPAMKEPVVKEPIPTADVGAGYDERALQAEQGIGGIRSKPSMEENDTQGGLDTEKLKDLGTSTETTTRGINPQAPDFDAFMLQMEGVGDVTPEEVDMDKVTEMVQRQADLYGIGTTTEKDAEKAREDAYQYSLDKMMYKENMSDLEKISNRREQLYEQSRKRDKLGTIADFLLGFGGATNIAYGLIGGAANLERSLANAAQREAQALDAFEEAKRDETTTRQELASAATTAAQAAYERTLQQRIAEQQMKSAMFNQAQQTEAGNANRRQDAQMANLSRKQAAITERFKGEMRKYVADVEQKIKQDSPIEVAGALINMLGGVEEYRNAILAQVAMDPEYQQQKMILLDDEADETQIRDARQRISELELSALSSPTMNMLNAIVKDMFDKSGYGGVAIGTNEDYKDAAGEDETASYLNKGR